LRGVYSNETIKWGTEVISNKLKYFLCYRT